MIGHEPLYYIRPKCGCFRIGNGDPLVVGDRLHTRHDQPPGLIISIPVHFHGALTARADGAKGWVPAEVRQIEAKLKAGFQDILSWFNFIRLVVDV